MKSIFKFNVSRLLQRVMAYHKKRPGKAVRTRKKIAKKRTIKKKSCFKFSVTYISEACAQINFVKTPRVCVYIIKNLLYSFNYDINNTRYD